MEWKVFSLSDIAHYSQGKQIPLNLQYLELNELKERFIRIVDFTSNWSQEPRFVDKDPKYLVNIDDIVMIRYGTPGKVFRGHKGIIANNLFKITFNEEIIDKDYAYWYLNQDSVYKQLMAGQSSSTMPAITFGMLKYIMVRVPPISYQRRIASILSSLDRKIELNNKINADLEEMAQAIFKNWFVDFEPFKGGKFVDSELGMIPEGWKVGTLADIAEITMGQSPAGNSLNENREGMIFYQGSSDFGFRFPSIRVFTTEPKRLAVANSVLFSVRAPVGDINVAKEECCIGRGVASIKSKYGHDSYLFYTMKSLHKLFDSFDGEGTVFGSINKKTLSAIQILLPSDGIVEQFNNIASSFDDRIRSLSDESSRLSLLRDTLLPRLMSGELEVPE